MADIQVVSFVLLCWEARHLQFYVGNTTFVEFSTGEPFREGSNEKISHESTERLSPYEMHCSGKDASPPEPGKITSNQKVQRSWAVGFCLNIQGKSAGTKTEDAFVCFFLPRVVQNPAQILCELQAAHIRDGSKLRMFQHLQPRLMCLVRSAVNALRTFGNSVLLCAQERKRHGENGGGHRSQALSIQGVRGVQTFVRDDPVPPLPVQQRSWFSWRVELVAPLLPTSVLSQQLASFEG